MENTTKTVSIEALGQILSVGAISTVATTEATATETASTEATATAQSIVSTVEHRVATEEVKEAVIVSIALDEAKFEGELSEVWDAVRNEEVNLNELFSTELSFVNGRLTIAISSIEATV